MQHKFVKHTDCTKLHCAVCDGGLAICEVCKCYEGALTTECPGHDCYATHGDAIYSGEIDFQKGQWVHSSSIHSPKYLYLISIGEVLDS